MAVPSTETTRECEESIQLLADTVAAQPCFSVSAQDVANARDSLTTAIHTEKSTILRLLDVNSERAAQHTTAGRSLAVTAAKVSASLQDLENDFNVSSPQTLAPVAAFMHQAQERHTSMQQAAITAATRRALSEVKEQYDTLARIEDAVYCGRGADLDALKSLNDLLGLQKLPNKPQVTVGLTNRCTLLRTLVSEQLSNALLDAVVFTDVSHSGPNITIQTQVKLIAPKAARSTAPREQPAGTNPSAFRVEALIDGVSAVGALQGPMKELQGRLFRGFLGPIVDEPTWKPVVQLDADKAVLATTSVGKMTTSQVVSNVKLALQFIGEYVWPVKTSCDSQLRDQFLADLKRQAFQYTLDRLIIPSMPSALQELPGWLDSIHNCVELESSLSVASSQPVLQPFVEQESIPRWLNQHKRELVEQGRHMSYSKWNNWKYQQVTLQDEMQSRGEQPPQALSEVAPPEEDGDGWGFDDSPQLQTTALGKEQSGSSDGWAFEDSPSFSTKDITTNEEDDEGWGFDDEPPVPKPQPSLTLKPTRQAKRLGKKMPRTSDSASPDRSSNHEEMEVEDSKPVASVPPPAPRPAGPVPDKSCRVSLACNAVLDLVQAQLREIEHVPPLPPSSASLDTVRHQLTGQLGDVLDLIRATVPTVHTAKLRSDPRIALQLSNDFLYLAEQLPKSVGESTVNGFVSASKAVFITCAEDQSQHVYTILSDLNGFRRVDNDHMYTAAQKAMAEAVSYIERQAAAIQPVISQNQYYEFIGIILEHVATELLSAILALEDITESDSERIVSLLNQLETLDHLFRKRDDEVSHIAAFVPHWLKLSYANELLRANLVDITYLYDNGSLVDYTSAELAKLVRALFADSEKRSDLLGKLDS